MSFPSAPARSGSTESDVAGYAAAYLRALQSVGQLNADIEAKLFQTLLPYYIATVTTTDDAGVTFAHTTTHQLVPTCLDGFGADMTTVCGITYASSNTGKATVNSTGLITGVAAGTCNVTVKAEGISDVVAVTLS